MIAIKRTQVKEAEAISELTRLAYEKECIDHGIHNKYPDYPSKESIIKDIDDYDYFSVYYHEDLIGGFYVELNEGTAVLEDFCIHPDHQNKGYGTQVLRKLNELNLSKVWKLVTPTYSVENQKLYEKVGFELIGHTSEEGQELLVYRKCIK